MSHVRRSVHLLLVMSLIFGVLGCEGEEVPASTDSTTQPAGAPRNPLASGGDSAPKNPLEKGKAESNVKSESERESAGAAAAPFSGVFHTIYQGNESIIRLEQTGQNVKGKIDQATIEGRVEGELVKGDVKNPDTGEVGGVFEMKRKGEDLEFQLTLKDPGTGQTLALPAFTYKPGEPPAQAQNLDPQLVGRWRYTWTAVSGDFTAATDTWLILNADGTYEYGYSKGGAGGSAGSVMTDRGDATAGKWRVSDRHLQYQENGTGPWQTFARYYVEGNTMMLTYSDGEKKIWYRQ